MTVSFMPQPVSVSFTRLFFRHRLAFLLGCITKQTKKQNNKQTIKNKQTTTKLQLNKDKTDIISSRCNKLSVA